MILKPENLYIYFALFYGFFFVIVTPPFQVPDEDSHFLRAYQISEGNLLSKKQGNRVGAMIPKSILITSSQFERIPFHPKNKVNHEEIFSTLHYPLDEKDRTFASFPNIALHSPVPYSPQATGLLLGRIFDFSPLLLMYLGRLSNLVTWSIWVYMAIKRTPIFKWVFYLLALTPMSLFEAASLSADAFTNGLAFFMTATCLQYGFDNQKEFKFKNLVEFLILSLLISLSKQVYILVPFLFLLIPFKKVGSQVKYFLYLAILLFAITIGAGGWSFVIRELYTPARTDAITSAPLQLAFIFSHPTNYLWIFFRTYLLNYQIFLAQFIGVLGWLDTPLPKIFWIAYLIILLGMALMDRNDDVKLNLKDKLIISLCLILSVLLITTATYIYWSEVGGAVTGLQGRYFIPLSPLFFLLLYTNKDFFKIRPQFLKILGIVVPNISLAWTLEVLFKRFYG